MDTKISVSLANVAAESWRYNKPTRRGKPVNWRNLLILSSSSLGSGDEETMMAINLTLCFKQFFFNSLITVANFTSSATSEGNLSIETYANGISSIYLDNH